MGNSELNCLLILYFLCPRRNTGRSNSGGHQAKSRDQGARLSGDDAYQIMFILTVTCCAIANELSRLPVSIQVRTGLNPRRLPGISNRDFGYW